MRRVPDKDDATAVPGGQVNLADGIEVELRVLDCRARQFGDFPFVVTGERVGEDPLLRVEVVVVVVDPG